MNRLGHSSKRRKTENEIIPTSSPSPTSHSSDLPSLHHQNHHHHHHTVLSPLPSNHDHHHHQPIQMRSSRKRKTFQHQNSSENENENERPSSSHQSSPHQDHHHYIRFATRTQLLRLKRHQLSNLVRIICSDDHQQHQHQIQSNTKESLINLIIHHRTKQTSSSSSSTKPHSSTTNTDDGDVVPRPIRTRLRSPFMTRTKSLPIVDVRDRWVRSRKVTFGQVGRPMIGLRTRSRPVVQTPPRTGQTPGLRRTRSMSRGSGEEIDRSVRKLRNGKLISVRRSFRDVGGREEGDELHEEEEEEECGDEEEVKEECDELEDEQEEEEEADELEDEDEQEEEADQLEEEEEEQEEEVSEDGSEGIEFGPEDVIEIASDHQSVESQEESVDLAHATSKGLLRLKRDNLVKLCEERELEVEGTKKELVENLLNWRDTKDDGFSQSSEVEQPTPTSTDPQPDDPQLNEEEKVGEVSEIKTPGGGSQKKSEEIGELLDLESLNLQDKEIHVDELKKYELIGSGGFKDVYRGSYRKVPVAIAEIRGHLSEMDLKELKILRDLRHENVVRFIGVSIAHDQPKRVPMMIVSEICTNGDLYDFIRSRPNPGLLKIYGIMKDIGKGLDYLHSRHPIIIHRDLKSSNVLITARGGLARIKNSTRSMVKSLVGTVNWQAPELWVPHPRYNEKVDVYSAGLVFWEMLQWHQTVKRYPFEGQNEHAIYQDVGQRQLRPATAGMRRMWGDGILDLIERLWNQNSHDRPSMAETLVRLDELVLVEKNLIKKKSHS